MEGRTMIKEDKGCRMERLCQPRPIFAYFCGPACRREDAI
jgi:hypothetical protein